MKNVALAAGILLLLVSSSSVHAQFTMCGPTSVSGSSACSTPPPTSSTTPTAPSTTPPQQTQTCTTKYTPQYMWVWNLDPQHIGWNVRQGSWLSTVTEACAQMVKWNFPPQNTLVGTLDSCPVDNSSSNVFMLNASVGSGTLSLAGTQYGKPFFCSACVNFDIIKQTVPNVVCSNNTLHIELTGVAIAEPWNEGKDPDHVNSKANVRFTALVYNQDHVNQPNVPVKISVDVIAQSGGHNHTDKRPKGKLSEAETGLASAPAAINGATDSNGIFSFVFGAEEVAGIHNITATCTGCTDPALSQVDVRVPNLVRMGGDPETTQLFKLQGKTGIHPDNHYYDIKALGIMYIFGSDFADQYGKPVEVNDSSLVLGGRFDLDADWGEPHITHRLGVAVDINNFKSEDGEFQEFLKDEHIGWLWEGKKKKKAATGAHYHLYLLGIKG